VTASAAARPVGSFDAFERHGWITAATAYEQFFGDITARVVDPLLDALGAEPGDTLLDLACGPGHLLDRAAARSVRAVGVDASPAMLEIARRTAPSASVHWADVQHLPFAAASFDLATAAFVLMHVSQPHRVVAEAARVLRSGGRAGIAVWDSPAQTRLIGWILDAIDRAGVRAPDDLPEGPPFFAYADHEALRDLMEQAGLEDATIHRIAFTHQVGSIDDLWDGLVDGTVRTAALLRRQDRTTMARVRREFDALVGPHVEDDGLAVPVSVVIGVGIKP
jgi:SAM-dependent methyltransferase